MQKKTEIHFFVQIFEGGAWRGGMAHDTQDDAEKHVALIGNAKKTRIVKRTMITEPVSGCTEEPGGHIVMNPKNIATILDGRLCCHSMRRQMTACDQHGLRCPSNAIFIDANDGQFYIDPPEADHVFVIKYCPFCGEALPEIGMMKYCTGCEGLRPYWTDIEATGIFCGVCNEEMRK